MLETGHFVKKGLTQGSEGWSSFWGLYICVGTSAHVHMCQGQKIVQMAFHRWHLAFETGFFAGLEIVSWLGWLQGSSCLRLPSAGIMRRHAQLKFFFW